MIGAGLLAALAAAVLPPIFSAAGGPGRTSPVKYVEVTVRHMDFKGFEVTYRLEMGKPVPIHDYDYWLRLDNFVSDFYMDQKTKEVRSRSNEMRNPAAFLTVGLKDKVLYSSWFVKGAETQHQVRAPGFYFQIKETPR